ncbi:MAG TPA: hypothetical protein VGH59_08760 [Casimicrobiaceae bacterium]|jgi:hypothetical protein
MRNKLLNSLMAATFATLAVSAVAQNATPREPTPGQAQPLTGNTQNGSTVGTTPSTNPTSPGMNSQYNTTTPGMGNTTNARMTNEQMREYIEARRACSLQTGAQAQACNDATNARFTAVDPKCQKLAGPALADCLRGADHGGN